MQRHQYAPYSKSAPRAGPQANFHQPTYNPQQGHLHQDVQQYHIQQQQQAVACAPPSPVPQIPKMPSYSNQALKTFAPEQMSYVPDACMVPIRSLQPGKVFVRVSGKAPDVKAFPDRKDPSAQRWLQSFTIKDDLETIDVKFWHKSQEHLNAYSNISLDQVIHVWTDEVKLSTKPASGNLASSTPSTSSPFVLNLSEGKVGHRIAMGNDVEQATMFKIALEANAAGVMPSLSIKQVMSALHAISDKRFNLVVCVKKLLSSGVINTKNGQLMKTVVTVFDAQGQTVSLTLWGETMSTIAQQWVTGSTETAYGLTFAILSEFDIDNIAADVLTAKWYGSRYVGIFDYMYHCPSCKEMISSYKMEACSRCTATLVAEDSWRFSLAKHISIMDDTAELYHPTISSDIAQRLLGFKPKEFSALQTIERGQLKNRHFLERFKIYFKVSWSDFKKQQSIEIISMDLAHLPELQSISNS
ncbi:hypothetical protein BGZ70_006602 [Mortierella alpina]|uniref:MEIOB-like N-terminal domain-containing protein n=1 Tax=Mortierella alpina TaxID=64518 RepID=A0A9P6J7Y1_MORAP|nr:hypothetical protein BGZ70_006602 [Mortierella alpina]